MNTKLKSVDAIPGSLGLPIVGNLIDAFRYRELFYWQRYWQYGKIFKMRFLGENYVVLIDPDASRLVLKDRADNFSSRLGWKTLKPILSEDMVLLQDGAEHKTSRRLILPIFHQQAIASYFDTMKSLVESAVADWGKQGTINLDAELRKLTLTVAVRIFLGSEKTEEIDRVRDLFNTLMAKANSAIVKWDVPLMAHGQGQAARRQIIAYILKVIQERQQRGDLDDAQDVLGLFLHTVDEDGQKFTEMQVANQALGFLFAAHETTATLMSWLLFELGNRPEWREKLRDEYHAVVGTGEIEMPHLRQLAQMTNVLKEGERLYPPLGVIIRGVLEDIEIGGYLIPAGWNVMVSTIFTHRLPEIYAEPDLFDPDRFALPRAEDTKHPYSLIGFGGGAHSCIGVEFAKMEMKLILGILLDNYDLVSDPLPTGVEYPVRRMVETVPKLTAKLTPLKQ
jgi:retinoid hydroxylase